MKRNIISVCLALLCCVAIFAKGAKEPAWISDVYAGYDENKYIIATSWGSSFEDSDKKALAGVGNIIRQDIDAKEQVVQSSASDGQFLTSYLSDVKTSTKIKSISGLSVKDRYKSKKGDFCSRAVLDKSAAAKYYSIELNKNSLEIDSLMDQANAKKSTFDACKSLMKAYEIALQNDEYLALLSVIKPSNHHILSYDSSAAIASKIKKEMSSINVVINIAGDIDGRLAAAVAESMNSLGITTSVANVSDAKSVYVLTADYFCEDIEKVDGTDIYFCRSILNCNLTESSSGKDILSFSRNSRQGKLSRKEAQSASLRAAENVLKSEFAQKFCELLK